MLQIRPDYPSHLPVLDRNHAGAGHDMAERYHNFPGLAAITFALNPSHFPNGARLTELKAAGSIGLDRRARDKSDLLPWNGSIQAGTSVATSAVSRLAA